MLAVLAINCGLAPQPVWADDKSNGEEEGKDGVLGALQSLLDSNTKTKAGKVLLKAYLRSAPKDNAMFRLTADAAKESIRDFFSSWSGQQSVSQEESYAELENAIRSLAGFYSKAAPSAPLPEQVKSEILKGLDTAEKYL